MNRLTEKIEEGFYVAPNIPNTDVLKYKLGKLEDIEEDLGCPLEVVFKALKYGIYLKYDKYLFSRCKFQKLEVSLKYDYGRYLLAPIHKADFSVSLEDYKKTWFLKEDRSE